MVDRRRSTLNVPKHGDTSAVPRNGGRPQVSPAEILPKAVAKCASEGPAHAANDAPANEQAAAELCGVEGKSKHSYMIYRNYGS